MLIFYHGKSLAPCILFHSVNNVLHVVDAEGSLNPKTEMINLVLTIVVLGGYLFYFIKTFPLKKEDSH